MEASSASRTAVNRWWDADNCSRTRLGSVMSVIEVTQPVCEPMASIKGETYIRASKTMPSRRLT